MQQVTKTDIAGMVDRLCELSRTDRATAMNALRSAMKGHSGGIEASMTRAVELLLSGSLGQAQH